MSWVSTKLVQFLERVFNHQGTVYYELKIKYMRLIKVSSVSIIYTLVDKKKNIFHIFIISKPDISDLNDIVHKDPRYKYIQTCKNKTRFISTYTMCVLLSD